jgi:hypothetical protein
LNSATGQWKLAAVSSFSSVCGAPTSPTPPPAPTPPTPAPAGQCVKDQHGPPCHQNADCVNITGCVRCANSGFCTDVKIL